MKKVFLFGLVGEDVSKQHPHFSSYSSPASVKSFAVAVKNAEAYQKGVKKNNVA